METLTAQDAKGMLLYVAEQIIKSKQYLTEVDSAIGDGDHGIGMETGFIKVREKLSGEKVESASRVFALAGRTMLMSMGGASGVIFGGMFLEGSKAQGDKEELNPVEFAEYFRASLEAIKLRGKAAVGDKTMVDALEPAVIALEENTEKGFGAMLKEAEQAAFLGLEKTKDMVAKFGRAKSLMERAVGFQDAGATSVWIIFKSMSEYVQAH